MSQDIFTLVLDFARSPSQFPDLFTPRKPLPDGIGDLLEVLSGHGQAPSSVAAMADESSTTLTHAIFFFLDKVIFTGGGDYYRILGLNQDANGDEIRRHYELLINLFYQDKGKGIVHWTETHFVKINRAYSVLKNEEKRSKYDNELKSQKDGVQWMNAGDQQIKQTSSVGAVTQAVTPTIHSPNHQAPNHQDSEQVSRIEGNSVTDKKKLPKILIVDSSTSLRFGLSRVLKKEFECVYASNGQQGWEFLQKSGKFQLLITELEMPQLDGYRLIQRIRDSDNPQLANISIIVVTGIKDTNAKQKAYAVGANDFMTKSTDYVEMLARVRVHQKLSDTTRRLGKYPQNKGQKKTSWRDFSVNVDSKPNRANQSEPGRGGKSSMFTMGFAILASIVVVLFLYLTMIPPSPEKGNKQNSANQISRAMDGKAVAQPDHQVNEVRRGKTASNGQGKSMNRLTTLAENEQGEYGIISREDSHRRKSRVTKTKTKTKKSIPIQSKKKNVDKLVKLADQVRPASGGGKPITLADISSLNLSSKSTAKGAKIGAATSKPTSKPTSKQSRADKLSALKSTSGRKSTTRTIVEPPAERVRKAKIVSSGSEKFGNQISSLPVSIPAPAIVAAAQPQDFEALIQNEALEQPIFAPTPVPAAVLPLRGDKIDVALRDDTVSLQSILDEQSGAETEYLITQRDLAVLMYEFVKAYEDGNLNRFISLFDAAARTGDENGKEAIRIDYQKLFRSTVVRRFGLHDMKWNREGGKAKGMGKFEVKIKSVGAESLTTFTGSITFHVVKNEIGLLIKELYH